MGKKKSKTAKRQQATKKSGGLNVKKGGGREQQTTVVLDPTKNKLSASNKKKRLRYAKPPQQQKHNKQSSGRLNPKSDEFSSGKMKSLQKRNTYERNQLKDLAEKQRAAWTEEESPLDVDNPYAALHQVDSDDDDDEEEITPQPLFQFAPESFGSSSTPDGNVDPDFISC
jgi:hypothetical protein